MSGVNVILFTESLWSPSYSRSIGPYLLASELRKYGYSCQVIDFYTLFKKEEYIKIIDKFVDKNTLIVGFSTNFLQRINQDVFDDSTTIVNEIENRKNKLLQEITNKKYYGFDLKNFFNLLSLFREKNKNIKFVSTIPNNAQHRTLSQIDCISGYAEEKLLEYVKKHDTKNIGKYNGEKFDFSKSKILWHEDDLIFPKETLPIEVSRGCIFKCKFCSFPLNGKKRFDYIKEPEILKNELLRNYELFGTTNYLFTDDTFNDSTYKLELLYNQVFSKLPFKCEIATFVRLDLLEKHKEQIQILNDIGIRYIHCGIESINYNTLKYIGKPVSIERVKKMTTYIKENFSNFHITGYFIFGLPYETKETLEDMYKWITEESLKYFDSIINSPFGMMANTSIIAQNRSKLGYYYDSENSNEFKKFYWKNFNGYTYKDCCNYVINANKYLFDNNMKFYGFLEVMKKTIDNLAPNNLNEFEKIEYVVNLYKTKLLK